MGSSSVMPLPQETLGNNSKSRVNQTASHDVVVPKLRQTCNIFAPTGRLARLSNVLIQPTCGILLYSLVFILSTVCTLRPAATQPEVPTDWNKFIILMQQTAVAATATGAFIIVVALNSHEGEVFSLFKWQALQPRVVAMRCLLCVCLTLAVAHVLSATQQTAIITTHVNDSPRTLEYVPLLQACRLVMEGLAFGMLGAICKGGPSLLWAVQVSLWAVHIMSLFVFTNEIFTWIYYVCVSLLLLFLTINVIVLLRLRSVALKQFHDGRPARVVARWVLPLYIVLLIGYKGSRIAVAAGRLDDSSGIIISSALDVVFLCLTAMVASDAVWQDEQAAAATLDEEKTSSLIAQAELDAQRRFLRYICHELRVPLNGIVLASQELQDCGWITAEGGEDVATIILSASSMTKLLDDFLTLAKIEAGMMKFELSAYDPHELVTSVVHMMRSQCQAKHISCAITIDHDIPLEAFGDAGRLRQVLANLMSNAIKFSRDGGTVRISVSVVEVSSPATKRGRKRQADATQSDSAHPTEGSLMNLPDNMARGRYPFSSTITSDESGSPKPSRWLHGPQSATVLASSTLQSKYSPIDLTKADSVGGLSPSPGSPCMPSPTHLTRQTSKAKGRGPNSIAMLRFCVQDSGIGIGEQDLARLFKPFEQIKAGASQKGNGTGLGLAICRHIVESCGGRISCESKEGVGSLFWFAVPVRMVHAPNHGIPVDKNSCNSAITIVPAPMLSRPMTTNNQDAVSNGLRIRAPPLNREPVIMRKLHVPVSNSNATSDGITPRGGWLTNCEAQLRPININYLQSVSPTLPSVADASMPHSARRGPPMVEDVLSNMWGLDHDPTAEAGPHRVPSPDPANGKLVAVVVDDTPSNRKLLARSLFRLGFHSVLEAEDGQHAVDLWSEWCRDGEPQVCFIDNNMPRMCGKDLVRHLRMEKNFEGVVIGVTGDALDEDRRAFMEAGLDDIIIKPCNRDTLVSAIAKHKVKLPLPDER